MKNIEFDKLTKSQQRIAIAEDVLQQLKVGRYIATIGFYIKFWHNQETRPNESIKENFEKIMDCKVCAMGACILSLAKFKNNLNFEDVGSKLDSFDPEKTKKLLSVFSPKQLLLIESVFEGISFGGDYRMATAFFDYDAIDLTTEEVTGVESLRNNNASEALKTIMQNIIKNDGEFVL